MPSFVFSILNKWYKDVVYAAQCYYISAIPSIDLILEEAMCTMFFCSFFVGILSSYQVT